jgi:beta-mannanase
MREEAPNLKFDFCINHGWTEGGKTSLANLYPGDKYVDIIGMDPYDGLSSSDPDPKVRWKQIYEGVDGVNGLADIKQFAHAHGKQVSLPEWGLTTKTGKNDNAYFIDQISNFTKDKDVDLAYQSYFDSPADLGTSLEQNPNAFEAYKRDFGGQTVNT